MSALFCLLLYFGSYSEKLEEYISTFYKIRFILEELYVAVISYESYKLAYNLYWPAESEHSQCCKMSMMQNDNDLKCQWYKYVNDAKCQWYKCQY